MMGVQRGFAAGADTNRCVQDFFGPGLVQARGVDASHEFGTPALPKRVARSSASAERTWAGTELPMSAPDGSVKRRVADGTVSCNPTPTCQPRTGQRAELVSVPMRLAGDGATALKTPLLVHNLSSFQPYASTPERACQKAVNCGNPTARMSYGNPQPSSQNGSCVWEKVQRLEGEESYQYALTSAAPERDDIVQPYGKP